jgi:hypothetical protein
MRESLSIWLRVSARKFTGIWDFTIIIMARLLEPIIGKRAGVQDFTAVVLVGHGEQ